MSIGVPSGKNGMYCLGKFFDMMPLFPWRPDILSSTWIFLVWAIKTWFFQIHKLADNERDCGSKEIEILLEFMENQHDDLVVILAGCKEPMDEFYESNPGLSSRIENYTDFPDCNTEELFKISKMMLEEY